jgi:hypothetical protein
MTSVKTSCRAATASIDPPARDLLDQMTRVSKVSYDRAHTGWWTASIRSSSTSKIGSASIQQTSAS